MIVRDEEHIVREALDSAAPHIDRWAIVDTGSTDDTVAVIERRMAEHGIPGEIHHRPWRDFGTNRTEALRLADGAADYLWVLDADDLATGDLDLTGLVADSYLLRYRVGCSFWRRQVFKSGLPWRYEGALHEYPVCDAPATEERLEGDYEILGRTLGARSRDPKKYQRDAEVLRGVLERDPNDLRALFYLGQSLADGGDDEAAVEAFARRAAAGGWDEERCLALLRRGDALGRLGRPWAESLESYLDAFEARPTRAEPLARIARRYREAGAFNLGYEFARRAGDMPYPAGDNLFVDAAVYAWAARDEQAVCAYHLGRYAESLDLGTALLASGAVPEDQLGRVSGNRDSCIEHVREARASHPAEIVAALAARSGAPADPDADVTVTIASHGDLGQLERTLSSFLWCCEDLDRVARFVCLVHPADAGGGRGVLARFPFLELVRVEPESVDPLALVHTPLWIHLDPRWELFSRGRHVERAAAMLAADAGLVRVAFGARDVRGERSEDPGQPSVADAARARRGGGRTAFFVESSCVAVAEPEGGPEAEAPGPEGEARLLADLVPGARVGELLLDVDPPWPVVSAAAAVVGDVVRLTVRTEVDDEAALDYEVALDDALQIEEVTAVGSGHEVLGPVEISLGEDVVAIEEAGAGRWRLVSRRDGEVRATPEFSLAGADEERAFALVHRRGCLVIVFGLYEERLAIAVVDEAAVLGLHEAGAAALG